ncbi:MAG: homoserine kinase [Polyangiaceae bacterium]
MAVHTTISEDDARGVLGAYRLGPLRAIEGIVAGSVNSNFALEVEDAPGTGSRRRLFLRVYEEQARAGAEHETSMLDRLAAAGVPTPAPLRRLDGSHVSSVHGKPAALFPWRPGTMRCQASVTQTDALRIWAALARVHVAGAGEEPYLGRFELRDLEARLDRIEAQGGGGFPAIAASLWDALRKAHADRSPGLPRGLIHGDLFRDQVLWGEGGEISALLDFESACDGTFAYDLMVTVLAWCVGNDLDANLAAAVCEGYLGVRSLSDAERDGLAAEGSFAALRFAITRITDFAMRGLSANDTAQRSPARDWRRFMMRFNTLQRMGAEGVRRALGL